MPQKLSSVEAVGIAGAQGRHLREARRLRVQECGLKGQKPSEPSLPHIPGTACNELGDLDSVYSAEQDLKTSRLFCSWPYLCALLRTALKHFLRHS